MTPYLNDLDLGMKSQSYFCEKVHFTKDFFEKWLFITKGQAITFRKHVLWFKTGLKWILLTFSNILVYWITKTDNTESLYS